MISLEKFAIKVFYQLIEVFLKFTLFKMNSVNKAYRCAEIFF